MRTVLVLLFAVFCFMLFLLENLFAASVEIPEITSEEKEKAMAVAFDFIYSKTLERDLKVTSGDQDKIDDMDQSHVKISCIKLEQLQPYVKLGVTSLDEDINTNILGLGRRSVEFEYDNAFSYGGGISGLFRLPEDFFIGYDGQYLQSRHDLDEVRHSGETATSVKGEALLQEWHAALFAEKKFKLNSNLSLTPYVGCRYSDLRLKIRKDIEYTVSEGTIGVTGSSRADEKFGVFTGVLLNIFNNWRLRLEGRFLDETAATVSLSYKF